MRRGLPHWPWSPAIGVRFVQTAYYLRSGCARAGRGSVVGARVGKQLGEQSIKELSVLFVGAVQTVQLPGLEVFRRRIVNHLLDRLPHGRRVVRAGDRGKRMHDQLLAVAVEPEDVVPGLGL